MIRIPGPQEAARVVRVADISLNSEFETVLKLNEEAGKQEKIHKVLLMAELGDLREGIWDRQELLDVATHIERHLENINLLGIGTNLGCYGSIAPTVEKMDELASIATMIEEAIGRVLEVVSGGSSTSFIRVLDKDMPRKINHLRIGENIITGRDLEDLWGCRTDFLFKDVFTLTAEIVEVKTKPTHPIGEVTFDAFRNKPVYEDRGLRRRAIAAVGKVDYAWLDQITPLDAGVSIVGASSDHTILDVEDADRIFEPGDMVSFGVCYGNTVFLTRTPFAEYKFV
jgi:predicted amino acid racemase